MKTLELLILLNLAVLVGQVLTIRSLRKLAKELTAAKPVVSVNTDVTRDAIELAIDRHVTSMHKAR